MLKAYWSIAGLLILLVLWTGWDLFRDDYVSFSSSVVIAPLVWIGLWSLALIGWTRTRIQGALGTVVICLIITLSLMGGLLGFAVATFTGLWAMISYGGREVEIARDYYWFFAMVAAFALLPGLLIAAAVVGFRRLTHNRSAPSANASGK